MLGRGLCRWDLLRELGGVSIVVRWGVGEKRTFHDGQALGSCSANDEV